MLTVQGSKFENNAGGKGSVLPLQFEVSVWTTSCSNVLNFSHVSNHREEPAEKRGWFHNRIWELQCPLEEWCTQEKLWREAPSRIWEARWSHNPCLWRRKADFKIFFLPKESSDSCEWFCIYQIHFYVYNRLIQTVSLCSNHIMETIMLPLTFHIFMYPLTSAYEVFRTIPRWKWRKLRLRYICLLRHRDIWVADELYSWSHPAPTDR